MPVQGDDRDHERDEYREGLEQLPDVEALDGIDPVRPRDELHHRPVQGVEVLPQPGDVFLRRVDPALAGDLLAKFICLGVFYVWLSRDSRSASWSAASLIRSAFSSAVFTSAYRRSRSAASAVSAARSASRCSLSVTRLRSRLPRRRRTGCSGGRCRAPRNPLAGRRVAVAYEGLSAAGHAQIRHWSRLNQPELATCGTVRDATRPGSPR